MLLLFPIFLFAGLFLPGFFIARSLRAPLPWASAFPFSLLVLFHSVFWLGVFHIALSLWTVLPCLLVVTGAGAWFARKSGASKEVKGAETWDRESRILLISSAVVGAVLVARSAISPLIGFDARFRWDFLARRILALRGFDFYPPLTPADFRTYFYVDGIPPLVSFTQWWLYVSAGEYLPVLISIFVTAQFICTLVFTYGAASSLFSRRAGVLAAAMLAACPLFFKSTVLGQETGLTALSIAATIYFIVTATPENERRGMIAAGLAAAVCALSREYGWMALIAGAIALIWRRQSLRQVMMFAGVAAAVAAPWYLRNWALTGNPFYSLSLDGFAVNPIHVGIMEQYRALLGVSHWSLSNWIAIVPFLLTFAAPQMLAGIPGALTQFRERGYLMVIAVLFFGVWLQSVGYTSGGLAISTRVLSPMMVALSISAGGFLERLTQRGRWRGAVLAAILVLQGWTALHGVLYPNNPSTLGVGEWSKNVFRPVPADAEFLLADQFRNYVPAGTRVLSDSAHLHAALIDKGIEVVPVWSPEVRFIFSTTPEEATRRLRELHIESIAYYPRSFNTRYLVKASQFYASLPKGWRIRAQIPGVMYLIGPAQ